jgi:translation initiation factor IF-2
MENLIRGLGVEIKGVMSTLDDDQAQAVRRHISGGSPRREPERRGPPASPTSPSVGPAVAGPRRPLPRSFAVAASARGPTDDEDMAPPPPPARPERPSFPERPAYSERPERPVMAERPFVAERPQSHGSQGLTMERPAERPQVAAPAPVVRRPVVAPSQPIASAMPEAQDAPRPEPVREPDAQPEPPRPVAEVRPEPPRPASAPISAPVAPPRPMVTQQQPPQRPMGGSQPQQRPAHPRSSSAPAVRPAAASLSAAAARPGAAPPEPKPAVGSRIQLPANTRRLPGGIAARMDEPTPGRDDRAMMPRVTPRRRRRGEHAARARRARPEPRRSAAQAGRADPARPRSPRRDRHHRHPPAADHRHQQAARTASNAPNSTPVRGRGSPNPAPSGSARAPRLPAA